MSPLRSTAVVVIIQASIWRQICTYISTYEVHQEEHWQLLIAPSYTAAAVARFCAPTSGINLAWYCTTKTCSDWRTLSGATYSAVSLDGAAAVSQHQPKLWCAPETYPGDALDPYPRHHHSTADVHMYVHVFHVQTKIYSFNPNQPG